MHSSVRVRTHAYAHRRLDVQNCNDDVKDFCGPAWEVINSSGIVFGKENEFMSVMLFFEILLYIL